MVPDALAGGLQRRLPAVFGFHELGLGPFPPVDVDGLDGQMSRPALSSTSAAAEASTQMGAPSLRK